MKLKVTIFLFFTLIFILSNEKFVFASEAEQDKKARMENGEVVYDYVVKNSFNEMELIESIKKYSGEELKVEIKFGYDDEGNSTVDKTYENGVLVKEEYYTNIDGYIYVSKEVFYDEKGNETDVAEYDAYGVMISK